MSLPMASPYLVSPPNSHSISHVLIYSPSLSRSAMSTGNSLTSRLEELRSRNPQSPQGAGESLYSGYNTPTRYSGSFMVAHSQQDNRASLQRRFTVDSNIMPALSPIGHQPTQNVDNVDMTASVSRLEYMRRRIFCLRLLTIFFADALQSPGCKRFIPPVVSKFLAFDSPVSTHGIPSPISPHFNNPTC